MKNLLLCSLLFLASIAHANLDDRIENLSSKISDKVSYGDHTDLSNSDKKELRKKLKEALQILRGSYDDNSDFARLTCLPSTSGRGTSIFIHGEEVGRPYSFSSSCDDAIKLAKNGLICGKGATGKYQMFSTDSAKSIGAGYSFSSSCIDTIKKVTKGLVCTINDIGRYQIFSVKSGRTYGGSYSFSSSCEDELREM